MTRLTLTATTIMLGLAGGDLRGFSSGPPAGRTGAPVDGGQDCTVCHRTFAPANSDPNGGIQLQVGPYTPGTRQAILVTVTHPEAMRWGFQLTARVVNNEMQAAGSFIASDEVRVICANGQPAPCQGAPEFVTHNAQSTRAGQAGSGAWRIEWDPPATDVGDIIFYAAGNAANNNGNNQGDRIYTTRVRIQVQGACPLTPRRPSLFSVVNGASFRPEAGIGANSMISLFGLGFTEPGMQRAAGPGDFRQDRFPTTFACIAVEIAGQRVPITFVKTDQINAQAPTLNTTGPVSVQVILNPDLPNEIRSDVASGIRFSPFSPAFFTFNGRSIAARHSDSSPVADPSVVPGGTPAAPGETITLYGTGFGFTDPVYRAGEIPPRPAELPRGSYTVVIGGVTLRSEDVSYAGLSPLSISGLYQFNVRIPDAAPAGDVPVQIRIGGLTTQDGATIPVRRPQ